MMEQKSAALQQLGRGINDLNVKIATDLRVMNLKIAHGREWACGVGNAVYNMDY